MSFPNAVGSQGGGPWGQYHSHGLPPPAQPPQEAEGAQMRPMGRKLMIVLYLISSHSQAYLLL